LLLSCLPLNTTLSFCLVFAAFMFLATKSLRSLPFSSLDKTVFLITFPLFVSAAAIADVLPLLICHLSLIPEDESGAVSEVFGSLCELPKSQVSQCITL
jgi:hypothetical protein